MKERLDALDQVEHTARGPNQTKATSALHMVQSTTTPQTRLGGSKDSYVYASNSHHLTTADGQLRRYDAAGNTIAIGGLESVHDAAGRLSAVNQGGATLATYRTNGDGQRVTRCGGEADVHEL